jgi:hypothetical protein
MFAFPNAEELMQLAVQQALPPRERQRRYGGNRTAGVRLVC